MNLTQTAIIAKQVITITIVTLVVSITSFIGYKVWYAYYLANLPPVEEKPDTKFGLLPLPDFPKTEVSSSNFSYSLDTTTGGLPKIGIDNGFEKIIKVYFIPQPFATLLSPDRSQILAEKFNIISPPQTLSETEYEFVENNEQGSSANKKLRVNLDSGNFKYNKEATISAGTLDDDNRLVSDFQNTLNFLESSKEELKKGRTKVVLLKNEGNRFTPTTLRAEAIAGQISLWPAPLDGKSFFTPDFNKSLVNAVVLSGASNIENYLSLNFNYYPVDTTTYATYQIKTAESAFEDLKKGKGMIIVEPQKPQVSITSVYLGYFLSENYSPYLQPIFVFEGPNFVAYVPAITEQFQSQPN